MASRAFKLANESRGGYQNGFIVRNQAGSGPGQGHVTSRVVGRPRLSLRTCAAFKRALYYPGSGVLKAGTGAKFLRGAIVIQLL